MHPDVMAKDFIELAIQIGSEPFRGISERGLESIRADKDSSSFNSINLILGAVLVGLGVFAVYKFLLSRK
jgi:hypothetical protein